MRRVPLEEKVRRVIPFLERAGWVTAPVDERHVARVVEAIGDRLKVYGDILLQGSFFFGDEVAVDEKAFAKRLLAPGAADKLAAYRAWLAGRDAFDAASLEKDTQEWLAANGLALGDIVHAVRVAVTGTSSGPGLFDCVSVVGKARCLRRIDRALDKARAHA
jgi:glutamyl-tRNA synthetase